MKPLFAIARPISNNDQGAHSNPGCVYCRVLNGGTIGAILSPVI